MLADVLQEDLEGDKYLQVEAFHKIEPNSSLTLYRYMNTRLYLLLKAMETLSPLNWRKYQSLALPTLTEGRSSGIQQITTRI